MEGINDTLKTLERYHKRGSSHQQKSIRAKRAFKRLIQTSKNRKKRKEKRGNTVRDPEISARGYT